MSAAPVKQLDLTAPPVVKTIAQRSLIVGVVFGIVAVILAFSRPEEFFRAYLLGFMCWLGVALGSMAILMIRHLTGGGWGMVIRRILGAAMRTLPLLALLFIPVILRNAQRCTSGRSRSIRSPISTCASISKTVTKTYLTTNGFILRAISTLRSGICFRSCCRSGRRKTDHAGAPDNTSVSRLSPVPASFCMASPSPSPPSTGSCRSIPAGSPPSSAWSFSSAKCCPPCVSPSWSSAFSSITSPCRRC